MITIAEYCRRRDKLTNTPFIITETGKGFFVEDGIPYTRKEFEQKYPLPFSFVSYHKKGADTSRSFLETD